MCVMFLHYISDEKSRLSGIKLLHGLTNFVLLNSVNSLTFQF